MRELDFIRGILDEVSVYLKQKHADRGSLSISSKKGVADLVTEADIEAQRIIESAIQSEFPGDILVGEEAGKDQPPQDPDARCSVCDPIDGTHNFARGLIPCWGISLAFVHKGEPQAGGITLPLPGQVFLAEHGRGATLDGRPIHVSAYDNLEESRVEIDFGRPLDRGPCLAVGAGLLRDGGQIRCHGSAVIGLCNLAAGACEAYVHGGLQPWDFAAGMLIVREAGGRVTRLDGAEMRVFDGKQGMLATNGKLHARLLEMVA